MSVFANTEHAALINCKNEISCKTWPSSLSSNIVNIIFICAINRLEFHPPLCYETYSGLIELQSYEKLKSEYFPDVTHSKTVSIPAKEVQALNSMLPFSIFTLQSKWIKLSNRGGIYSSLAPGPSGVGAALPLTLRICEGASGGAVNQDHSHQTVRGERVSPCVRKSLGGALLWASVWSYATGVDTDRTSERRTASTGNTVNIHHRSLDSFPGSVSSWVNKPKCFFAAGVMRNRSGFGPVGGIQMGTINKPCLS